MQVEEKKTKCFTCPNEAIAIINTCSPTSSTGMTDPHPRCEECIGNMRGHVNIIELFVSKEEFDRRMTRLVKWERSGAWLRPETVYEFKCNQLLEHIKKAGENGLTMGEMEKLDKEFPCAIIDSLEDKGKVKLKWLKRNGHDIKGYVKTSS